MIARTILIMSFLLLHSTDAAWSSTGANLIEKSLQFTENTSGGKKIPLGDRSGSRNIPIGAEVDINSTISISIRPSQMRLELSDKGSPVTDKDAVKLREALELLEKVVQARLLAIEAFANTERTSSDSSRNQEAVLAFRKIAKRYDSLENKFFSLSFWQGGLTFNEEEGDVATEDSTFRSAGRLLQGELSAIEERLRGSVSTAERNNATLRIEAFLETSNATPTPIHLPGYDRLEQKEVATRNQQTDVISKESWRKIQKEWGEVVTLAHKAEAVRTGELALNQAILDSGHKSVERLASLAGICQEVWDSFPNVIRLQS